MIRSRFPRGIKVTDALGNTYRSGLEAAIAADLKVQGIKFEYEKHKVKYTIPTREATYTPDFKLPNGIIIEAKGRFETDDRHKHLLVRESNPKLDIRFVFTNPLARISKASQTTYAMWCEKHGFLFAKKLVPVAWGREARKA